MMVGWPEKGAFHSPEIDHISYQIECVAAGVVEKIQQELGFTVAVTKMNVR